MERGPPRSSPPGARSSGALRETADGSEDSERLVAELVRLRAEYLEVVAQAAAAHAPEPSAFPDDVIKPDSVRGPPRYRRIELPAGTE